MSVMKELTKQAMAESKVLHERAVREITSWLSKVRNLIVTRVHADVEYFGDFTYQLHPQEQPTYVLVKAEQANIYGNFFFETWRDKGNGIKGWFTPGKCVARWLAYYFIEDKELWMISYPDLMEWAFKRNRLSTFKEKVQSKRIQENDAWGRVVPIATLERELGRNIHKYSVEA